MKTTTNRPICPDCGRELRPFRQGRWVCGRAEYEADTSVWAGLPKGRMVAGALHRTVRVWQPGELPS